MRLRSFSSPAPASLRRIPAWRGRGVAPRRLWLALACLLLAGPVAAATETPPHFSPDDPMLRRCIDWMMNGYKGAFIQELCLSEYGIPPPSLVLCVQKVQSGFVSTNEREACAVIFEEQAKRARAGYIKDPPAAVP